MGKNKKSRQHSDFAKPNRKPGKVLKKTNVTDTTFKTKKIELFHQLHESSAEQPKSSDKHLPRLSVQEICQNLNHFQESMLKRALEALLELHNKDRATFEENLNRIIPAVGRLLAWDNKVQDNYIACLNKVFVKILQSPDELISANFDRICTLSVLGLTNPQEKIKVVAIHILNKHIFQKKAAAMNRELFKSYLRLISTDCIPGKIHVGIIKIALSSLPSFLNMYTRDNSNFAEQCTEVSIQGDRLTVTQKSNVNEMLNFPIDARGQVDLPFMYPTASKQGLVVLADACFVFLGRVLVIENFPTENYISQVRQSLLKLNQIINKYAKENGVTPGFFGERFLSLAEKNGFKAPASKHKELETSLKSLSQI